MKNKMLICFIIMILLGISFFMIIKVNATLGTFRQNECVNIKTILNSSLVNISTINYPNSSLIISNKAMTKIGLTFNYTFCDTSTLGVYTYDYFDNEGNVYVNDFYITSTGKTQSLFGIIFYIASLSLLFIFLGLCLFSFMKVDNILNRVSMIGIAYLLAIAVSFVSYQMCMDYVGDGAFVTNMVFYIWVILMYGTIIAIPCAIGYYMYAIYQIKEIQQLVNKGIPEDEAQHRVKNRRRHGK